MRIGPGGGVDSIVNFTRRLNETSQEVLRDNAKRLEDAVARGRELPTLRELTAPTSGRLDRNSSELESTVARTKDAVGRIADRTRIDDFLAGRSSQSTGSIVDISA